MQSRREQEIDHLFRRAGFGASQEEIDALQSTDLRRLRRRRHRILNYERSPTTWTASSGCRVMSASPAGAAAAFSLRRTSSMPASDGCSGWCTAGVLFRKRWRSSGTTTSPPPTRKWSARSAIPRSRRGCSPRNPRTTPAARAASIELFRDYALGNFRDMVVELAKDPAMLVWLDGRTNVRARPQENFARELMELFTIGVGKFEETDVYAGARVFTGWNLALANRNTAQARYEFAYNAGAARHRRQGFSFPIYRDGGRVDPGAVGRRWHAGRSRSDRRGRCGIPRPVRGSRASCTRTS